MSKIGEKENKLLNKDFSIPAFSVPKYTYNLTTVKKYGNNFIGLSTMNVQRTPGSEVSDKDYQINKRANDFTMEVDPWTGKVEPVWGSDTFERMLENLKRRQEREKNKGDYKKMIESLIRSKRMVFEYAFSNEWDYFATFTIDPQKFDRYNLNEYHKKFSHWLRNYFRRKFGENVQYLCIPEQHKDGAWHEHALIKGISKQHLELFKLSDDIPKYIRDKLTAGEEIYNCPMYMKKFGWCTFEPVRNSEACAKYITKYITKDMLKSVTDYGAKIYYASRGINKAEVIAIGHYDGNYIEDFSNDYCRKAMFAYDDNFMQLVKGKIK
ncbi:MAG: hypothetical protein U0L18_02830 [Acutalibacteraceae bacterium]|nr:hypothetical protein [Acutalibacteraceae bacterium]